MVSRVNVCAAGGARGPRPTLESSANGLSGSESLAQCEKEVGEPTSEAGGVGSSFFTLAGGSTSMETRSFRDSERRGRRWNSKENV